MPKILGMVTGERAAGRKGGSRLGGGEAKEAASWVDKTTRLMLTDAESTSLMFDGRALSTYQPK